MKANELRIGNYALYPSSNLENGEDIIEVIKVTSNDIKELELKYILYAIPLTEEWLTKFGFKYYKSWNYWQIKGDNILKVYPSSIGFYFRERFRFEIKSVHQLQNLYFALTGEELTTPIN